MTGPALRVLDGSDGDAGGEGPYVIVGWDSRAARPGLSRRSLRAARVVAETLFSSEEGPPPAARLDWMEHDLGDFFGHVTLRARLLFRACVATVYWLSPLLIGRAPTLARLDLEDRVRALHRLERTPLALALLAAKAILAIVYFEHPDAAEEIGWDQRCLTSASAPPAADPGEERP